MLKMFDFYILWDREYLHTIIISDRYHTANQDNMSNKLTRERNQEEDQMPCCSTPLRT
jgi:hypothetical protein